MAAVDLIPLVAPQYVGDARLTLAITEATKDGTPDCYGSRWDRYVALMAAHYLCLSDRATASGTTGTTAAGAVTSINNLSVSIGYGSTAGAGTTADDAVLMSTPYGAEAMRLRDATACRMPSWVR